MTSAKIDLTDIVSLEIVYKGQTTLVGVAWLIDSIDGLYTDEQKRLMEDYKTKTDLIEKIEKIFKINALLWFVGFVFIFMFLFAFWLVMALV
jgi:hypothetical protein